MKRIVRAAAAIAFASVFAAAQCVFAAEFPAPDAVTAVEIGGNVTLEKVDGEWLLPQYAGAPVNQAKARRVLDALLAGTRSPVPAGAGPDATGLADGGGLRIAIAPASPGGGGAAEFFLGLRPEGDFDAAYVKMPDGAVVLVNADLRGELGLWKNRPDETPEQSVWFADSVGFDPAAVVGLTATYPDHAIALTRERGGETWTLASPAPGGELSQDGVRRWLRDLSDFKFTGVGAADSEESWTHSIALSFEDGTELTIRARPDHAGGHALAALTPWPVVFMLPQWRFGYCFNRLDSLFPKAAPHFALSDVRLIDVRRDGESVKITRRDGTWEPVALPYAAKAERVERLARFLAAWRPEDYADADAKARPAMERSVVEVVLANGDVHQYRLSGRHPVFPWRSVVLDGKQVFSVTDAEAAVMFPGFADVLELGTVFAGLGGGAITGFAAEDGSGEHSVRFVRDGAGAWTAETAAASSAARRMPLEAAEAEALASALREWRVTGFAPPRPVRGAPEEAAYRVSAATGGTDGASERSVTLFAPAGRDVPYALDRGNGEEYFLASRAELHSWLVAVKEIARRADEYAARIAESERLKINPAEVDFSGSVREKAAAGPAR